MPDYYPQGYDTAMSNLFLIIPYNIVFIVSILADINYIVNHCVTKFVCYPVMHSFSRLSIVEGNCIRIIAMEKHRFLG